MHALCDYTSRLLLCFAAYILFAPKPLPRRLRRQGGHFLLLAASSAFDIAAAVSVCGYTNVIIHSLFFLGESYLYLLLYYGR